MMTIKENKQQKVDHEPVRAMVETPCKIYLEARQKAAALRRARGGTKKVLAAGLQENHDAFPAPVPIPNGTDMFGLLQCLLPPLPPWKEG